MTLALEFANNDMKGWKPPEISTIPSLIKWTGSKRSQTCAILRLMSPYRRYFEPFVGGGAMLYGAAIPGTVASDIYKPLIELWLLIQREPLQVVQNYQTQWNALNAELNGLDINNLSANETLPSYFYKVRERFNRTQDPLDLNFIMRTCVNGIVRFNDKGFFNNSFHLSRRGMKPATFEKVVSSWQRAIQNVEFVCQDYELTLERCVKGDFVYLDPPYAGNKQRYADDLDLKRFWYALDNLNRHGVNWALSFDGRRGKLNLVHDIPKDLYKRHILLSTGSSAVNKVLNGSVESVQESVYLNY